MKFSLHGCPIFREYLYSPWDGEAEILHCNLRDRERDYITAITDKAQCLRIMQDLFAVFQRYSDCDDLCSDVYPYPYPSHYEHMAPGTFVRDWKPQIDAVGLSVREIED
jgi:hypothetical protein